MPEHRQRFRVVPRSLLANTIDEIPVRFPQLRHLGNADLSFRMRGWMRGRMRGKTFGWMRGLRQRILQQILLQHPLTRPKVPLAAEVDRGIVEVPKVSVSP